MRAELKHIEAIEKYLAGKMTAGERAVFEETMTADPGLAQQVETQKQLVDAIRLRAFHQEVLAFHAGLSPTPEPKPRWTPRKIYLNSLLGAITLFAAGTVTYLISFYSQDKTPAKHNKAQEKNIPVQQPANQPQKETESTAISEEKIIPGQNRGTQTTTVASSEAGKMGIQKPKDTTNPYSLGFHSIMVNSERDTVFEMIDSKSLVRFTANSLEDAYGNSIQGEVEIRYREYRNAAQMAFSGIPMTFVENQTEYVFNSAGMFEIRAFQKGKELRIKDQHELMVDYNVTSQLDDCFFFALDENGTWSKKRAISYRGLKKEQTREKADGSADKKNQKPVSRRSKSKAHGVIEIHSKSALTGKDLEITGVELIPLRRGQRDGYHLAYTDSNCFLKDVVTGQYRMVVSSNDHVNLTVPRVTVVKDEITPVYLRLKPFREKKKKSFSQKLATIFKPSQEPDSLQGVRSHSFVDDQTYPIPKSFNTMTSEQRKQEIIRDSLNYFLSMGTDSTRNSNLKSDLNKFTGKLNPNQVSDLSCPKFGVYNCDQAKRVINPLEIQGDFVDEKGQKISSFRSVSMIDLDINGAISFAPGQIVLNAMGRNILLIYTANKQLFCISEEELKRMNISKSGTYTFQMKNITAEVKDAAQLAKYLRIE